MSATLESKYVSLNGAVTRLAFGDARTPNEELNLPIADQKHLAALIDRCHAEASGDDRYHPFLKPLPFYPVSTLIERLPRDRNCWPPSAVELHAYAKGLVSTRASYAELYEATFRWILSRAAEGMPRVIGRTAAHLGAAVEYVEPLYFLANVTLGHTYRDIGPVTGDGCIRAGSSILHPRKGSVPIFYDVMVLKKDLNKLRGDVVPGPTDQAALNRRIDDWYERNRAPLDPRPTREEDEDALRDQFPEVPNLRFVVRDLREKYPVQPGRRKSAKK